MADALATPNRHGCPAPARTLYASPLEMAEWLAAARPGATMQYATGPALDHREPAAILAGQWGRAGTVHPFQKRRDPATLDFFVRKMSAPVVAGTNVASGSHASLPERGPPGSGARRPQDDAAWEESEQGRVYRLLCRCANLAQPCPSNQAVADRLDLTDRNRAQYLIRQLCERGLIRLEAAAKLGPRVVRIVATGKVTPENNDNLGAKR